MCTIFLDTVGVVEDWSWLARADDARPRVVDDVGEIVRGEAEVDRYEHGPDLRDRVERLELRVRIRRDVDDAVALLDTECLQRGGPAIAALEEVAVREALVAVDDSLARRIQATRAPGKLERGKGNLQRLDSIGPQPPSSTGFRDLRQAAVIGFIVAKVAS